MSNGWTRSTEKLLRNWSQQISINEAAYRKKGAFYRGWYWGMGVIMVFFQTGALITIVNLVLDLYSSDDSSGSLAFANTLLFVGIIEVLVLIAQGIDKFFNFGSASEQFFEAAKEHNALGRLIDSTLTLPRNDRSSAKDVLISIRQQFDALQYTSPNLPPNEIVHRLDMCIYEDPEQARGKTKTGIVDRGDGKGLPVEEVLEGSPPPDYAKQVKLKSPLGQSDDDEYVSNAQKLNLNKEFREQKNKAKLAQHNSKKFKNLEYQWGRMQQHDEEDEEKVPKSRKNKSEQP